MCGRLAVVAKFKALYEYLNATGAIPSDEDISRYNLPPSYKRAGDVVWEKTPILRFINGERRLDRLAWPLIPSWAKGELPKYSTANCRSEVGQAFSQTIQKKPTFRGAWQRSQRCLIPASWFYEWDQRSKPKTPYRVYPLNEPFFTFAGLWDQSQSNNGQLIESFTIITTSPNQLLQDIGHHRAPVNIEPEKWDAWLTGHRSESEALLVPPASDEMEAIEVSKAINNPGYDDVKLIQ